MTNPVSQSKSPTQPHFSLEQYIALLSDPAFYPHPVEVITTIETHISVVFLTGEFAYKLKKPVDFGFLDFSQLAARKKFCALEVALNQRTAPELYLGVETIFYNPHNQSLSLQNKSGEAVEYLVKMRQFDPNAVLGRQGHSLAISRSQIESLALQIARLHQQADGVDLTSTLGLPKTILQPMLDNFNALEICFNFAKHAFLDGLYSWTLQQYETFKPLIEQRRSEGKIRACHGDLHLDNIALIANQPVLFDGIEFNDEFRWIDGISDLAFLLMDLCSRHHPALAWQILSLYLHHTQDYPGLPLLRFYMVYRAMVRAKITNLRAEQLADDSHEKQHLCSLASDYVDLAQAFSQAAVSPKLILLQGVSGTGKSHLSNQIQALLESVVISSDLTRKTLFGIDPLERVDETQKRNLYSPQMNAKSYQGLLQNARISLQSGWHTLVDATFLKYAHRAVFYQLAEELGIGVYLLYIDSDVNQDSAFLANQLKQRELANNNPSDADAAVMLNQFQVLEKPQADEPALWLDAKQLRNAFPANKIKQFLDLPITS
ncbi:AAA family ATPase [Thiosulfatimonas sediminis]|nr:bifunctional aminoglycoside phosphotransferase/ATP-binding protein [Thiosulfatimonas sediminis]